MSVRGPRRRSVAELARLDAELARPAWSERDCIRVADGVARAGARVYFMPVDGDVAFEGVIQVASSSASEAAVLVVGPGGTEIKLPAWDLYLRPVLA